MSAYGKLCRAGDRAEAGDIGFVVWRQVQDYGGYEFSREPSCYVGSPNAALSGLLGEWNNVQYIAEGLGRIVSRDYGNTGMLETRFVPVPKSKVKAALTKLGYPELAEAA